MNGIFCKFECNIYTYVLQFQETLNLGVPRSHNDIWDLVLPYLTLLAHCALNKLVYMCAF